MQNAPPLLRRLLPLLLIGTLAVLSWQNRALFTGGPPPDPETITLTGSIEVTRLRLASRIGGRIEAIEGIEGAQVEKGQLILTLRNHELVAEEETLRAQLAGAEATYADLARGARPEELAQASAAVSAARQRQRLVEAGSRDEEQRAAEAEVALAKTQLAQAAADASRARSLYDQGVIAKQEWEHAESLRVQGEERVRVAEERAALVRAGARDEEIGVAQAEVARAQAGLDLLAAGSTPEALARAQASIDALSAQLRGIEDQLAESAVRSPSAGTIDRVLVEEGEVVAPGQHLATLRVAGDVRLKAYLPEPDLGHVRIGQEATIVLADGTTLKGAVHSIAAEAEFTPRNIQTPEERATQVFAVEIRIAEPPDYLRDGMTVEVRFARLPLADTPQ